MTDVTPIVDWIVVGNHQVDYNSIRHWESLPFRHVKIRKTWHLLKAPNYVAWRLLGRTQTILQYLHCDLGLNGVDLLHFFNGISLCKTPWITTFETAVPRWNRRSRFGLRLLAGASCRKLIAISQTAFDIQCAHLAEFPEFETEIMQKLMVLHPAQPLQVASVEDKPVSEGEDIVFTLVGRDFFRKGGSEILWASDQLIREGFPLKLNIVSRLDARDYISGATSSDINAARTIISQHPERIAHYPALHNRRVIDLFKRSHVGLLPSYDETYGYAVLEAQACGCPVITTRIRALAEANCDDIGYVIDVPTDEFRRAVLSSDGQRRAFREALRVGVYDAMRRVCENRHEIALKGARAIGKIRSKHDPRQRAMLLEHVYLDALR
jgi:glycosyltransferase involved in cell wall biosynthesis